MKKPFAGYWTKERVQNGLRRFVRDFFAGREEKLPWNAHVSCHSIPDTERRTARRLRLYPPYHVVMRHYESITAAWADLGHEVKARSLEYWTREEVIEGLKRFYKDFGFCPTSSERYIEKSQFSPRHAKDGSESATGAYGKYPSFICIRKFFASMREAWRIVGFDLDHWWEPWSPAEDWFILESVGVMPRTEVAEALKRTVPAINRRLYDLGRINSKNRWGLSINRAAGLMGLGGHVVRKYLDYGLIPFYRGNKQIYLNPADLLEIREIDWAKDKIHPELEYLIRKSLIHRLAKIIEFRDRWRDREIYTYQKTKDYLALRTKKPRRSAFAAALPAPPNDLTTGDWVILTKRIRQVSEERKGIIKAVFYSPPKHPRADGSKRSCWMASVEFPKITRLSKEGENRIHYNLPLDVLRLSAKPEPAPLALKMNPGAIRSRKRRAAYRHRAGERFQSIKPELT